MSEGTPKISEHPVAARQLAHGRAWAAVIGFLITFWFSHKAGMSFPASGMRAIGVGLAARLLVWALLVSVWRQVIPAQIAAAQRQAAARMQRGS
jgi:hypothetical protein